MTQYIKHQREYTVAGASAVLQAFIGKPFSDIYGGTFRELIGLVKDGVYYHYQIEDDRERLSKLLLDKVNAGGFDLEALYPKFDSEVSKYEELIGRDPEDFDLAMIKDFFRYYEELLPVAYAGMDPIDFADMLDADKRAHFKKWAAKVRTRGEVIYKNGETKFMPVFLEWLSKKHLGRLDPELLQYALFTEILDLADGKGTFPDKAELEARRDYFYIRHFPVDMMEYASGPQVQLVVDCKNLMGQKSDELEDVTEFTGQAAFKGKVRGKARIIRSTADMKDFRAGEIIVSQMTQPNYLAIMKQAIAFVTNEGGTLCHAAIVARELEKPCIVGTKIATHVLKDGDEIEVNADEGVVMILKRS